MSKALSLDLRTRVLLAVSEGMSHRAAGARFGVSAASVSRWRALEREQGDARPNALGGDRRSGEIEAQCGVILGLLEDRRDMTIEELRAALEDRGLIFSYGSMQRFLVRHAITRKKRPATRQNRIARMF